MTKREQAALDALKQEIVSQFVWVDSHYVHEDVFNLIRNTLKGGA